MAKELPYLPSYKNVGALFEKIQTAKVPEAFTTRFLSETLGLKSVGDRPLIALLKALGFLDNAGRPTPEYATLKNESVSADSLGAGVCKAYSALFAANEKAHTLSPEQLRGLVAQVAGTDAGTTGKIAGTFRALCTKATFDGKTAGLSQLEKLEKNEKGAESEGTHGAKGMRPDFHYNIQVHLPSNGTEEVYISIFNAIRKVFK